MTKEKLMKQYNTMISFQRILNTFHSLSHVSLGRLMKILNKLDENLENISELSKYISTKINARNNKKIALVFFSDKGMCGGYNTSIYKHMLQLQEKYNDIQYIVFGKKGERYIKNFKVLKFITCKINNVHDYIYDLSSTLIDYNLNNIYFLFYKFSSYLNQEIQSNNSIDLIKKQPVIAKDRLYLEDNKNIIPLNINDIYLQLSIYYVFLQAFLSEEAMRIQVTFNAKKNTEESIEDLQLKINKSRKNKATTEILEITSASEVLKDK